MTAIQWETLAGEGSSRLRRESEKEALSKSFSAAKTLILFGARTPVGPASAGWRQGLRQRGDPIRVAHFEKAGVSSAEIHVAPVSVGIEEIVLLAQANCANFYQNQNNRTNKEVNTGFLI